MKIVNPERRGNANEEPQGAETLFRAHGRFIASFLHRYGVHEADVEDAVQEVFIVAHQKGGYRPGPAAPRSWLAAIAIRVAASTRRQRARRRSSHDQVDLERIATAEPGPGQRATERESLARVQRALDSLDDEHRAAFVLFEIEGQGCEEIAATLGIPIGTVYSRLHNARRRFREAHRALDDQAKPSAMLQVVGQE